ncbi:hypothetical protein HK101_011055 [Irineochytrium annulatum]|nr:hypothetical protein HK101_011055 [Irineochytrium annulatum]
MASSRRISRMQDSDRASTTGKRLFEICQEGKWEQARKYASSRAVADSILQTLNSPIDMYGNTSLHVATAHNDVTLVYFLLLKGADPSLANRAGIQPITIARRCEFHQVERLLRQYGAVLPHFEEADKTVGGVGAGAGAGAGAYADPGITIGGDSGQTTADLAVNDLDVSMRKRSQSAPVMLKAATPSGPMQNPAPATGGGGGSGAMTPTNNSSAVTVTKTAQQVHPTMITASASTANPRLHHYTTMPTNTSSATAASSPGACLASPEEKAVWMEVTARLIRSLPDPFIHLFPSSAYLNSPFLTHSSLPLPLIRTRDRKGWTALMKASYRGHAPAVRHILTQLRDQIPDPHRRCLDVDAVDPQGLTALVWASLAGRLDCVALLCEAGARVEGGGHADIQPWLESFTPTPLMVASFMGHVGVVEYLIGRGCDVNYRVGAPRGVSAVMMAAWLRREGCVRALVTGGAALDPDIDVWLKKGLVRVKRMSMEHSCWSHERAGPGGAEKMWLLTAEDSETVATLKGLLNSKAHMETRLKPSGSGLKDSGTVLNGSQEGLAGDGQAPLRPRAMNRKSRLNMNNRQGLNLDKLIGGNPQMIIDLTMEFPERGTDLDFLCKQVFTGIYQLVMAANKNMKSQYAVISATALHHSRVILNVLETMEKSAGSSKNAFTPISPLYSSSYSNVIGSQSLFANSRLSKQIQAQSASLRVACYDELSLNTKLACGVWPSPTAVGDMIRSAATFLRTCRKLVDLANVYGYFPLIDKPLDIQVYTFQQIQQNLADLSSSSQFEPYQHGDTTEQLENEEESIFNWKTHTRPNVQTFEDYISSTQIKKMSEYGNALNTSDGKDALGSLSTESEPDPDEKFITAMEKHLHDFVKSVTELKRAQSRQLRDQYVPATKLISERVNGISSAIQNFDLFQSFRDGLDLVTFTQQEIEDIEATGVQIYVTQFPCTLKLIMKDAEEEVQATTRSVVDWATLAAGAWPPPDSERQMLVACLPCVVAVKKMCTIMSRSIVKMRAAYVQEQRTREQEERQRFGDEILTRIVSVWNSKLNSKRGDAEALEEESPLSPQDVEKLKLQENNEGLVFEPNSRVIRGGKLIRMVESMTSCFGIDEELMSAFILTHHSFTTSVKLLNCLIIRYCTLSAPGELSERLYNSWKKVMMKPAQLNVLSILKYWLKNHFEEDFAPNNLLLRNFREFLELAVVKDWEAIGTQLVDLLNTMVSEFERRGPKLSLRQQQQLHSQIPQSAGSAASLPSHQRPVLPRNFAPGNMPSAALFSTLACSYDHIYEIDPLEWARQLTLIEFDDFKKVKPHECLAQIWASKLNKERDAARVEMGLPVEGGKGVESSDKESAIMRMITHTNLKCRELNNFNGITGIVAALSMAPIARLKKTWQEFADKWPKMSDEYEEVAALVSPKGQYANYRKELKDLKPPAIPFLGVYLTDLTFIELGNADHLPDSRFINFEKRRKVNGVIREIQRYQVTPYPYIPVEGMRMFLNKIGDDSDAAMSLEVEEGGMQSLSLLNEDELYNQSLVMEPREEEEDDD